MLTAISFVLVFGLLVFFHEGGHFLLARYNGITVHEFSLGMGPKIFSKKGKETLYAIRLLPIGGYVQMEGEDEVSDKEGSFSKKSPLQRLSVIAAGPIMNFLLAIVLFMIIFAFVGLPTNVIDDFASDSPAYQAGLQKGDEIVSVNNEKTNSWDDVVKGISNSKETLEIEVNRNGEVIKKNIEPKIENGRKIIGIYPKGSRNPIKIVGYSVNQVYKVSKAIVTFFVKLPFEGMNEGDVVGPVGLVSLVGDAAQRGFLDILSLAALISINLGIVNLLPIPALDGGRIIFILIELFRGKPVDPEKEGYVHLIGFAILLSLMAFLVFKDVKELL
ncbi:MAG: RIP metalloprotease RseP [Bacillota bacterium]